MEQHLTLKVTLQWRHHSIKRKHPFSVVGWPLWTENWKLCQKCKKFAPRLGEKPTKCHPVWPLLAVVSPRHVPPTCSIPETTRGVWLPGPSATTVTGSKHNWSWQGHESGGGRLVCRPPGRRQLLSASASPNLQSLHGNTHLFSKQSLLNFTVGCSGRTLGWLTK